MFYVVVASRIIDESARAFERRRHRHTKHAEHRRALSFNPIAEKSRDPPPPLCLLHHPHNQDQTTYRRHKVAASPPLSDATAATLVINSQACSKSHNTVKTHITHSRVNTQQNAEQAVPTQRGRRVFFCECVLVLVSSSRVAARERADDDGRRDEGLRQSVSRRSRSHIAHSRVSVYGWANFFVFISINLINNPRQQRWRRRQ